VASIEAAIDELYQGPLGAFIPARNALARTLKGGDAKRVKALSKPTVVPWAVNQVYWHARPTYDRVAKSGARLRAAQVAALEGHPADVREARAAHQKAISDAVAEAMRLATAAGAHPGVDQLSRTFEALTLLKMPPGDPGRLVTIPEPAGFEALSGIPIAAQKSRERPPPAESERAPGAARGKTARPRHRTSHTEPSLESKHATATGSKAVLRLAPKGAPAAEPTPGAAGRTKPAHERALTARELRKADAAVRRAEAAERRAHRAWETAKRALEKAVRARALAALRAPVDR
jgi:hypothetical protein